MPASESADPRVVAAREGAIGALPLLVGIVPFGIVFGATVAERGYTVADAVLSSAVVFAGAAQLAVIELSATGAGPGVVIGTALVINLRMMLYSASLAPHLSRVPLRTRLAAAYFLTDQAFALSVDQYERDRHRDVPMAYYFGAALTMSSTWVPSTLIGAIGGEFVPESIPLDLAVPLVFLTLLVPAITSSSRLVAAVVGAAGAVAFADLPANIGLFLAAVVGIAAGTFAWARNEARQ